MVPLGAKEIEPSGLLGKVAYGEAVGDAPAGFMMRVSALLVSSPLQLSSVKKSPLNGSIENSAEQSRPETTVRSVAPVDGSIWIIEPLAKLPVLSAFRPPYRLPLLSKRISSSTGTGSVTSSVLALATPPPGGNL